MVRAVLAALGMVVATAVAQSSNRKFVCLFISFSAEDR